jgi:hypothetical protein
MSTPDHPESVDPRHVTLHLTAQTTVEFTADQAWPRHGDYSRFGIDLASFAEEISRRLRIDGYVGFSVGEERITVVPLGAIKRIDFYQSRVDSPPS